MKFTLQQEWPPAQWPNEQPSREAPIPSQPPAEEPPAEPVLPDPKPAEEPPPAD